MKKTNKNKEKKILVGGGENWSLSFMLAKQALYHLSPASSSFYSGYFGDGVLLSICPN
jgi:hypothetical protein